MGAWLKAWFIKRLVDAGRFDRADRALKAALLKHPENRHLVPVHALAAQYRGLYGEAINRWNDARQLGAREPLATARLVTCLRMTGACSDAQSLVDDALVRYPKNVRVLVEAARLAEDQDRFADAVILWQRALARARPEANWLRGYALSLWFAGDLERAQRVVASARRRHPRDLDLIAAAGWIATGAQDWTQAATLLSEHRRQTANEAGDGWEVLGFAKYGALLHEITETKPTAPVRADIDVVVDEPMRRLVMGFESIGEHCELGLVQRRFGAEPLGLLRWNDVGLDDLIEALSRDFEGMGEPHNTIMVPMHGELYVKDRRWSLAMHTFLPATNADPNALFEKMCKRIAFLRRKFIEDLRAAEKIFVYRSATIDPEGLRRLHEALRQYGPVKLFGVTPVLTAVTAFPDRAPGEIEYLGDGLCIGFLGTAASMDGHDGAYGIDFETWAKILSKAADLMRSRPVEVISRHGFGTRQDGMLTPKSAGPINSAPAAGLGPVSGVSRQLSSEERAIDR